MFTNTHNNRKSVMCCRMFISRAYDMAGAFDWETARLLTKRC